MLIPSIEGLSSTKFAFATDENSLNISHSTFNVKSIKRRAMLLYYLFPKQRKLNL